MLRSTPQTGQVNTTSTGFQRSLALASDPSGNYAVAALASLPGGGQVHLIIDVNGYYQ